MILMSPLRKQSMMFSTLSLIFSSISIMSTTSSATPNASSSSAAAAAAAAGNFPFERSMVESTTDISFGSWHELGRGIGEENLHDKAGFSVTSSAEGNIVAVGSPYHDSSEGRHAGRVRIYRYDPFADAWRKIGSDLVGNPGDEFGFSVSLSITGDFLAVGAPKCTDISNVDGTLQKEIGCVHVYERLEMLGDEDYVYEPLGGRLKGDESFDHFGYSVLVHDIYEVMYQEKYEEEDLEIVNLVIGAPGAKDVTTEVGKVFFKQYRIDGGDAWEDHSTNGDDEPFVGKGYPGSRFGSSVSMSIDDNTIAVGSPKDQSKGMQNAGAVYLFHRSMETEKWQKISGVELHGDEGDECGATVSITLRGDYIAYGCPMATYIDNTKGTLMVEAGKVVVNKLDYIFESGIWVKELVDDVIWGEYGGDRSGTSIDIGREMRTTGGPVELWVAIGAPNNYPSPDMPKAGHVRVYHLSRDEEWIRANLDIDGLNPFDEFGTSVAVNYDGHRIVAGAPGGTGYAKIFDLKYTEAPSLAPTVYPTETPKRGRPGTGTGGGISIKDTQGRSGASTFWLTIFVLVLIPSLAFFAFKAVLYWRSRRTYESRFGSDVRVDTPNDLELTRRVENTQEPVAAERDII